MILEDALQMLSKAGVFEATVTEDGKSIGSVELNKMTSAIARPREKAEQSATYR